MCQVSVPYLSTIYLFIDDASGAQQYHQLQLGFYNGNALYLDKEGDYLTESVYTDKWLVQKCLPKTQQRKFLALGQIFNIFSWILNMIQKM